MILSRRIEETITEAIQAEPDKAVILPSFAYTKEDRVIVTIKGLPIDLHRHLHNILIRPLGYHEQMRRREGVDPRNVNPYLFTVVEGSKSLATRCRNGHLYEGNEAPPNWRGYRCATCLRALYAASGPANGDKTHCPEGHEYTRKNTLKGKDGRRRCRTCRNDRNRAYMAEYRKREKKS